MSAALYIQHQPASVLARVHPLAGLVLHHQVLYDLYYIFMAMFRVEASKWQCTGEMFTNQYCFSRDVNWFNCL